MITSLKIPFFRAKGGTTATVAPLTYLYNLRLPFKAYIVPLWNE